MKCDGCERAAHTTAGFCCDVCGAWAKRGWGTNREGKHSTGCDAREGMHLRDEAIERVDRHADPGWMERAVEAVRTVAARNAFFTTDPVWRELNEAPDDEAPNERRAMGAVMKRASKLGICEATPRYEESNRPVAHRNPKRIWHSKINGGGM